MKLRIDNVLVQADGETPLDNPETGKPLTLKEVMINSILFPVFDERGKMTDDGPKKMEKYRIWELLKNAKPSGGKIEVELSISQAALVSKMAELYQAQLVYGQIYDAMEKTKAEK